MRFVGSALRQALEARVDNSASANPEKAMVRAGRSANRGDMIGFLAEGTKREAMERPDGGVERGRRLSIAELTDPPSDRRVGREEHRRAHQHEMERNRIDLVEGAFAAALAHEAMYERQDGREVAQRVVVEVHAAIGQL